MVQQDHDEGGERIFKQVTIEFIDLFDREVTVSLLIDEGLGRMVLPAKPAF